MGGSNSNSDCGCLQGLLGSQPQPRGEIRADGSSPKGEQPPYLCGIVGDAPLGPQSLHSLWRASVIAPALRAERPKPSPAGGFELQIQALDEHVVATAEPLFSPQNLHSRWRAAVIAPALRAERPKPSPAGGFELQIQELDEHVVATAEPLFSPQSLRSRWQTSVISPALRAEKLKPAGGFDLHLQELDEHVVATADLRSVQPEPDSILCTFD